MRLRLDHRGLGIISSLPLLATSLPFSFFSPHLPRNAKLIPRASYSVVAVDGGAQAAASGGLDPSPEATVTVLQTIIQTAAPAPPDTLIVVSTETDIVPAGTETLLATTTVPGQNSVETSILTVLPPAITIISTDIRPETILATTTLAAVNMVETSIITVEQPAVTLIASISEVSTIYIPTTVVDNPSGSSSAIASTLNSASPSGTLLTLSSITTSQSTSLSIISPDSPSSTVSHTSSSTSSSTLSTPTTSIANFHDEAEATTPTKSSTTYDNGMWHTTYPTWSNSTSATRVPRRPQDPNF